MKAALPSTAVGKDFPYDGRIVGWTPSKTGARLNLGGYFGITLGWYEGIEVNLLGAVAGVDIRRPGAEAAGSWTSWASHCIHRPHRSRAISLELNQAQPFARSCVAARRPLRSAP